MRIAVLYPKSQYAAWSMSNGLVTTLRRMGHEVVPGEMPGAGAEMPQRVFEGIKAQLPALDTLKKCDAILVSGPEHIAPWLDAVYTKYEWKNIGVPKAAWWHETMHRADYTLDWDSVSMWADENFVPAYQDAEWLDQEMFGKGHVHWLPFGVDTEMFRPCRLGDREDNVIDKHGRLNYEKTWPIAFVGLVYEKRGRFLQALSQHDHPPIRIGNVSINDLSGYCSEESVRRLVENYRRVKVFFNLPAMSALLVTKIYEVMACGTFLLTPQLSADRGISKNQEAFESGRHLVYYRSSNLPYVAQLLREWPSDEKAEERERIAAEGCREVHEKHSLEKRLTVILEKIGVRETVQ